MDENDIIKGYNAAITFTLELSPREGIRFLELWNEGCWPEIGEEFPDFDLSTTKSFQG